MKVIIVLHHRFELWNAPSWFAERLRSDFPELNIVHLPTYEGVENELPDAEVAISWSIRPEQLRFAPKLRWIHSPAAAVHQLMFPELVNSDIVITNAREVHGPVVAEHVIAQIFALAKKLPDAMRLQKQHIWGKELLWIEKPSPREVSGATLGLVGLGSIGRAVARKASALGMQVIAVRRNPENAIPEGVQTVFGPDQLNALLSQSDYVVLAAPLTPQTTALINADRLAQMKREACLINVSRGPLVDEAALANALRANKIAAAALDVFPKEPLPTESPLWDLENLLITPHTAAVTAKLWDRHYVLISENLRRYLARQPLLCVVNKHLGY